MRFLVFCLFVGLSSALEARAERLSWGAGRIYLVGAAERLYGLETAQGQNFVRMLPDFVYNLPEDGSYGVDGRRASEVARGIADDLLKLPAETIDRYEELTRRINYRFDRPGYETTAGDEIIRRLQSAIDTPRTRSLHSAYLLEALDRELAEVTHDFAKAQEWQESVLKAVSAAQFERSRKRKKEKSRSSEFREALRSQTSALRCFKV